jgi:hypothetical protein
MSCKKDSPTSSNDKQEKITVDDNLLQPTTTLQSETEILTNNTSQPTQQPNKQPNSDRLIQNQEEKNEKSSKAVSKPIASNEVIMASPEFKAFMDAVFTLSDESTTEELNYVNSFMDKHDLWKEMRNDQCNLLDNEKIKLDPTVFHFWEKRCNFSRAQKKIVKKFNISYNALGKLMHQKRNEREFNPDLAIPENQ